MNPGEIYRHDAFYRNAASGALERKYFVILARTPGNDLVARLLTSRPHARPEAPKCFHGHPYPGFFLGVLGEPLIAKSWVDMRYLGDLDPSDADRLMTRGVLGRVITLDDDVLAELIECVANADDTTRLQEVSMRDQLARLR